MLPNQDGPAESAHHLPAWLSQPIPLPANQPVARPYHGGAGIAKFRGTGADRDDVPEDFIASTTEVISGGGVGLTVLADGRTLREHIRDAPELFLGPQHAAAHGAQPALLVKLLDTAERLFVHLHPDDAFAARHLMCPYGKTEAWFVVAAEGGSGEVFLGFGRDVPVAEVRAWVDAQDAPAMLAAMNRLAVRPGDSVLVPGGVPHAIGAGVTLVELQEPTDFSILLEWEGYGVGPADADLGLGLDTALTALDRSAWTPARIATLRGPTPQEASAPVARVFPPQADRFFRAERLRVDGRLELAAGFSSLIVLDGEGELVGRSGAVSVSRGSVVLLPYACGDVVAHGRLTAVRCLPPL